MTSGNRNSGLLHALIVVNGLCATTFLLLFVASGVYTIGSAVSGTEEPEGVVGWVIVGVFAAAMASLSGVTTARLWRRLRDTAAVTRGPAVWGAALGGLALAGVLAGVAFGSGGILIGLLLAVPFIGLVLAAIYLR